MEMGYKENKIFTESCRLVSLFSWGIDRLAGLSDWSNF